MLDTFSKRIIVIAVSLSLVLLSASAFLLTIQRATAAPMERSVVPKYLSLFMQANEVYLLKWDGGRYRLVYKPINQIEPDGIN